MTPNVVLIERLRARVARAPNLTSRARAGAKYGHHVAPRPASDASPAARDQPCSSELCGQTATSPAARCRARMPAPRPATNPEARSCPATRPRPALRLGALRPDRDQPCGSRPGSGASPAVRDQPCGAELCGQTATSLAARSQPCGLDSRRCGGVSSYAPMKSWCNTAMHQRLRPASNTGASCAGWCSRPRR